MSKPDQTPQKQVRRSNCIEEVCFFFPRRVKVAHINQIYDSHHLQHDWFLGVRVRLPSVPVILDFSLQWHLQFENEVVLAAHEAISGACQKYITENITAILQLLQVPLTKVLDFLCRNLSQTSAEINMGEHYQELVILFSLRPKQTGK